MVLKAHAEGSETSTPDPLKETENHQGACGEASRGGPTRVHSLAW